MLLSIYLDKFSNLFRLSNTERGWGRNGGSLLVSMCSRMVTSAMEAEIKCPSCESGFVEEIGSTRDINNNGIDFGGEHAFSTWHCLV